MTGPRTRGCPVLDILRRTAMSVLHSRQDNAAVSPDQRARVNIPACAGPMLCELG
jgi:hypothetical protein